MNDPQDVEAGEGQNPASPDDIVVRASERIPSPVVGPDASTCPVREETAARTEVLNGTALDARLVRLPRAGVCGQIYLRTSACHELMRLCNVENDLWSRETVVN
jgi:hypothetical protein